MLRNTAAIHVGRLLEVRAEAGYRSAAEVDQLFDQILQALAKLPRTQTCITVVDWRRCPVMAAQASERIVQNIVSLNSRTDRSAALASRDSQTAVLQFMRMIRESANPNRRMFFSADELYAWLSDALTPAESQRLKKFLAE